MIDRFYVEVTYYAPTPDTELEHQATDLMDALQVEPNLIDPDVGINHQHRAIDVCCVIEGASLADALSGALVAFRSALRHIGANGPEWEEAMRFAHVTARPNQLIDR